uniref:Uncharacterized protein n=1 Tax=Arundo donax TaxID=35708 RepID=A0A0A9PIU5_ARUDO
MNGTQERTTGVSRLERDLSPIICSSVLSIEPNLVFVFSSYVPPLLYILVRRNLSATEIEKQKRVA